MDTVLAVLVGVAGFFGLLLGFLAGLFYIAERFDLRGSKKPSDRPRTLYRGSSEEGP